MTIEQKTLDRNVEGLLNRLTEYGSYAIPSSHEQDCIEAVTEIRRLQKLLAALPSTPVGVVKPLAWGLTSYGTPEVHTVIGVYRLNNATNGGWTATIGREALRDETGRENFATTDAAKAAVQTHFAARILSALASQPAPAEREGYVLVPVEPTPEMEHAALERNREIATDPAYRGLEPLRVGYELWGSRQIYAAMLASRPIGEGAGETRYIVIDHTGCEYVCEDRDQATKIARQNHASTIELCAAAGYRVCAETRHVALGDKVRAAIRDLPTPPLVGET
jgi:hypothetical protein